MQTSFNLNSVWIHEQDAHTYIHTVHVCRVCLCVCCAYYTRKFSLSLSQLRRWRPRRRVLFWLVGEKERHNLVHPPPCDAVPLSELWNRMKMVTAAAGLLVVVSLFGSSLGPMRWWYKLVHNAVPCRALGTPETTYNIVLYTYYIIYRWCVCGRHQRRTKPGELSPSSKWINFRNAKAGTTANLKCVAADVR